MMNLGGVIHLNKTGLCIVFCITLILFYYALSNRNPSTDSALHQDQVDLRTLLNVAVKAAVTGGREVVAVKDAIHIESKGLTKEGAKDSVTTADFRSHCAMKGILSSNFPRLTVISEEAKTECDPKWEVDGAATGVDNIGDFHETWIDYKDVVVWIDPLDATQEYTEKKYEYVTTMVCVAVKGTPVIGVVHRPFSKETSWAWLGNGKSSNLEAAEAKHKEGEKLKFIISRSHTGNVIDTLKNSFKGQDIEFVIAAGAGYKVLEVVKGNADAYMHITAIKKWDICAGDAILTYLGGKMTTKDNSIIRYGPTDGALNEQGLVATLRNHDNFINKL